MKLSEYPPEFRKIIEAMKPEMQAIALSEITASDLIRLADLRLREMIATYGPSRYLVNAADRLQEAHSWSSCFDPKTDSMVPPPSSPVQIATEQEAKAVVEATQYLKQ